jgi:hypothetical protein
VAKSRAFLVRLLAVLEDNLIGRFPSLRKPVAVGRKPTGSLALAGSPDGLRRISLAQPADQAEFPGGVFCQRESVRSRAVPLHRVGECTSRSALGMVFGQEKGVRNRFPAGGLQVDTPITENGS